MNVATMLLDAGRDEDPALFRHDRRISYHELRRLVDGFGRRLETLGEPGDRVGILAENGEHFVAAYLGVLKAGRVAVPLATPMPPEELRRISAWARLSAVAADARHAASAAALGLPVLTPAAGTSSAPRDLPDGALARGHVDALQFADVATGVGRRLAARAEQQDGQRCGQAERAKGHGEGAEQGGAGYVAGWAKRKPASKLRRGAGCDRHWRIGHPGGAVARPVGRCRQYRSLPPDCPLHHFTHHEALYPRRLECADASTLHP